MKNDTNTPIFVKDGHQTRLSEVHIDDHVVIYAKPGLRLEGLVDFAYLVTLPVTVVRSSSPEVHEVLKDKGYRILSLPVHYGEGIADQKDYF
ncbi:MAG: hypothetical protein Q8R18_04030 [bacterium]|nr:hypothetical protein [bacterium]